MAAIPSGDEEKQNPFCSLERHGFATSNTHFFDFLFDTDNYLSRPIDRSRVRSGSRFLNDIHNRGQILYESY